jgi:hypothetical protein
MKLGTRADVWTLSLLLRKAFDHFASHLDKSFNFVKAWLEINPVVDRKPLVTGILKLVTTIQRVNETKKPDERLDCLVNKVKFVIL